MDLGSKDLGSFCAQISFKVRQYKKLIINVLYFQQN